MKLALCQINSTVGDFEANRQKIRDASVRAASEGADMVCFPELSVCGYPPMDLLDHQAFVDQNIRSIGWLQHELPPDVAVLVGYVDRNPEASGKSLQNVASIVHKGAIVHRQAKRLLPTYDVFDEARYFQPDQASSVWTYQGERIGIAICEDIWWETEPVPGTRYPVDPVRDLVTAGATLILSPSASPFHPEKLGIREQLVTSIGRTHGVPVAYVNAVGANDSLIFDGHSLFTNQAGRLVHASPGWDEHTAIVDAAERGGGPATPRGTEATAPRRAEAARWALIESALVLGLRDYLKKTGFSRVHFGLSGGIDSAVVAVIAARALGPERVKAFLLPSQYSSSGSISDSEALARNLGIDYATIPIKPIYDAFATALENEFAGTEHGVAEENIQARARGNLLMAWSNKFGSLTLTTGNKSELAVGYCTLYGDMSGGLGVIGDLFKTEVYELARYWNRDAELIPWAIIDKAPSAELRPDQTDQDSLPPYPELDGILHHYLIKSESLPEIVAAGFNEETVAHILRLVGRSEYKRRQAPPVLKVSPRAFGTGRRMPIARVMYEIDT